MTNEADYVAMYSDEANILMVRALNIVILEARLDRDLRAEITTSGDLLGRVLRIANGFNAIEARKVDLGEAFDTAVRDALWARFDAAFEKPL